MNINIHNFSQCMVPVNIVKIFPCEIFCIYNIPNFYNVTLLYNVCLNNATGTAGITVDNFLACIRIF